MFSGSNSYLGGNQSGRPGAPQYANSFNTQQGQMPQQQAPNAFQPQPTGYGQAPLQQQYTGYPMQQQNMAFQQPPPMPQQPQYTGFPGTQQAQQQYGQPQQQQSFQTGAPPMPQQPQQTALQPPAPVQKPQPTGFSAMAASFKTESPAEPRGRRASKAGAKIPNIRLSFITAQDQAKFETLFKSAAGTEQTLSGDKSRDLLLRSKLDGNSLSQIWYALLIPQNG